MIKEDEIKPATAFPRSTSTKYGVNWTSGEPALIAPIANVIAGVMTMTMTTKIAVSAVHGPGDE